ncbi:hypothetical protein GGI42DRAFT_358997 [Trichoderma sp. SZMC 28013]
MAPPVSLNRLRATRSDVEPAMNQFEIHALASALLPTIVATARWEVGQGVHPLYRRSARWTSAEYNIGRQAAKKKALSQDRVMKRVYRKVAAKAYSDDEDLLSKPSSQQSATDATCKRRRVDDIGVKEPRENPNGAVIVVEESDGWASDNLVMVSYWWKGSVSTPNPHKAALPTPDSWTSQDQESGGAALSPSEDDIITGDEMGV